MKIKWSQNFILYYYYCKSKPMLWYIKSVFLHIRKNSWNWTLSSTEKWESILKSSLRWHFEVSTNNEDILNTTQNMLIYKNNHPTLCYYRKENEIVIFITSLNHSLIITSKITLNLHFYRERASTWVCWHGKYKEISTLS